MNKEENTGCKNKEKCCSVLSLETGIKCIGAFLLLELLSTIYSIFGRTPSRYLVDILATLMTGVLFACFVLVMVKKDSEQARRLWMGVTLIDLIFRLIIFLLAMVLINGDDKGTKDFCTELMEHWREKLAGDASLRPLYST